jgi:lysozyme
VTAIADALKVATTLCKQFEGFRSQPYLCPAGVPTIGYGATYYLDGRKVTLQDPPITLAEADALLESSLATQYLPSVLKASPRLILTAQVLGAMTDFAFNLGVARYRASTLRKRIDAQSWDEARIELGKWVRGGGKILPGLVRRRAAECVLLNL